ncbi:MAG TPA: cation:proton antiporter [Capsulimonadaceae bacterium]|nr:cation:proton antiporter [Capsulimonadaceae bacterium]
MNDIGSLGVILLLALLAGHIVKWLRVPEVTGYLLAGVALGPSVLGWVSPDNLSALQALSEVALGLILFSIGTVFEVDHFRRIGPQLIVITVIESVLAAAIVGGGMLVAGQQWQTSLLLGAMAIETAAASTLMVLRECNAKGELTSVLMGVFALDNLLCLITFNLIVAAIELSTHAGSAWNLSAALGTIGPLVWQIVGSAALGYMIGFLLAAWSARVVEHGEQLILLAGCVLLCVGAAQVLNLSAMVTNLSVGATVANLSQRSRNFIESLEKTDPPLYAIFFVLAGAGLRLSLLTAVGIPGLVYLVGRLVAKIGGARIGAAAAGASKVVQRRLPFAMCAQAGLAVGLTMTLERRLPQIAPTVSTIVLSAVIIFEVIGPLGVRWSIVRSGEAQPEISEAGDRIVGV